MLRAFIFDKDATLYNAKQMEIVWFNVMKRIFPNINHSYKKRVKWENWHVLDKSIAQDMAVSSELIRKQREHIWKIQTPFPGVKNFLDDWPYANFVCTADDRLATVQQFERDNLSFKGICCGDDENIKNKPDPTGIIQMLDEFNIRPNEACIVGDSECDMQLKTSGKLQMAIFVDVEGNRPIPKEADLVVRCVTDIPSLFKKRFI